MDTASVKPYSCPLAKHWHRIVPVPALLPGIAHNRVPRSKNKASLAYEEEHAEHHINDDENIV
jgi:hypothetical protein